MQGPLKRYNPKDQLWRNDYDRILSTLNTQNTLVIGDPGLGKTTAISAISTKLTSSLVLPLRLAGMSPEHFALDVASIVLCQASGKEWNSYPEFRGINNLLRHATLFSETTQQALHTIDNELQKIKPNQKLLVQTALSLPSLINEKQITVLVDDAQRLLELTNYEALKDPFSCLETAKTRWLLASDRPLPVKGFATTPLSSFSLDELKKVLHAVDDSTLTQIHSYVKGIPSLAQSLAESYDGKRSIKRHYIHQLLQKNTPLNRYATEQLNGLLNQARGATLLEAVLRILSEHGALTLSDLSRRLYRAAPVTKSILLRLLEVGLIQQDGRLFSFRSSILRDYVLLSVLGLTNQEITTTLLNQAEGRL